MPGTVDSKTDVKANTWLKPAQVEAMRNATVQESASYLTSRNDALIALLYDTGLRVGECVVYQVQLLYQDDEIVRLPVLIQKDNPYDISATYTDVE